MTSEIIDATPTKKSYLAIINDYDFNTAVCELVDNAIDVWWQQGRKHKLKVSIRISPPDDLAIIEDNSGGVDPGNLELLVQPGASTNTGQATSIGVFGVGSKRSAISVAKRILIRTRVPGKPGRQIEYGDKWISESSWNLQSVPSIQCEEGHTIVELHQLRRHLSDADLKSFVQHLQETYAKLVVDERLTIVVNNKPIKAIQFDDWAYPQGYEPYRVNVTYSTPSSQIVNLKITAGLLTKAGYENGEWGVYFYCNNRLIQKAVRTSEVGFSRGEIGVPHHSHSASRVIVELTGPASLMPWTSNKSAILFSHETYRLIQSHVVSLGKTFAKISKALVQTWQDDVFSFSKGEVKNFTVSPDDELKGISLPIPPPQKPSFNKEVRLLNSVTVAANPSLELFLEGINVIEEVQHKGNKSRTIFLIIFLDATLRLAIQDYIRQPGKAPLVKDSADVLDNIRHLGLRAKTISLLEDLISMRTKIDSEVPRPTIDTEHVNEIRFAVQGALLKMFNLKFPLKQK